jgi:hypothetical protein
MENEDAFSTSASISASVRRESTPTPGPSSRVKRRTSPLPRAGFRPPGSPSAPRRTRARISDESDAGSESGAVSIPGSTGTFNNVSMIERARRSAEQARMPPPAPQARPASPARSVRSARSAAASHHSSQGSALSIGQPGLMDQFDWGRYSGVKQRKEPAGQTSAVLRDVVERLLQKLVSPHLFPSLRHLNERGGQSSRER